MRKWMCTCSNKPYVLGFYGSKGKTTLITKLLSELGEYRICVLKFSPLEHEPLDVMKDSGKMRKAGALSSFFISQKRWELVCNEEIEEETAVKMLSFLFEPDAIFVEGARGEEIPKVFIGGCEKRENTVLDYDGDFEHLLEYVKMEIETHRHLIRLPGLNCGKCGYSCREMAEMIRDGKKMIADCRQFYEKLELCICDTKVNLTKFPKKILYGGVAGMLAALKDVNLSGDEKIRIFVEKI